MCKVFCWNNLLKSTPENIYPHGKNNSLIPLTNVNLKKRTKFWFILTDDKETSKGNPNFFFSDFEKPEIVVIEMNGKEQMSIIISKRSLVIWKEN